MLYFTLQKFVNRENFKVNVLPRAFKKGWQYHMLLFLVKWEMELTILNNTILDPSKDKNRPTLKLTSSTPGFIHNALKHALTSSFIPDSL